VELAHIGDHVLLEVELLVRDVTGQRHRAGPPCWFAPQRGQTRCRLDASLLYDCGPPPRCDLQQSRLLDNGGPARGVSWGWGGVGGSSNAWRQPAKTTES